MAYGLKYQTQFTSQSDANNAEKDYTLQFLFKDYTGGVTSIDGADTTVIQKCTVDNPTAEIKGQSLEINLINRGNVPITAFQSEDDNGVQVKLLQGTTLLFIGFLVQDDFYETMVDYTHSITLSATDGLGLLKGVILSEASVRRVFNCSYRTNGVDTVVYFYSANAAFFPQAGNTIEIGGVSYIIDTAVYESTTIGIATYNWTITLTTTTGGIAQTVADVYLTGEINLMIRNSLLSIIAICLYQTNLTLTTNIFSNIYEYRQDATISTLDQTLVDSQMFAESDTYDDCYSVLSKILIAFNLTLIQANGEWNLINFYEVKEYTDNAIPGFVYDDTWLAIGNTTLNNTFFIGPDPQLTRPIAGLTQGALRGFKFVKKQFDYRQPKYIFKNNDLQILGDLLREYIVGIYSIKEYVATWFEVGVGPIYSEYFIRVTTDIPTNTEVDRYLVVRGNCSDTIRSICSNDIEISEGDKVNLSFSVKSNVSTLLYAGVFAVRLSDNTTTKYVDELPADNGAWISTVGFNQDFYDTGEWESVSIQSSQTPYGGIVKCFLAQNHITPYDNSRETYYKDITFTVDYFINDSIEITGQLHTQEQPVNKKNNSLIDIKIDDSPRNSIQGTLFMNTKTGVLQDRTIYWRYPLPNVNAWRLGELTTLQELSFRQTTRQKYEGGFIGNYQTNIISLLSLAKLDFNTSKNYTFGMLSIDFKRNRFSGTLWELSDNNDAVLDHTYLFKYLL